LDRHKKSEVAMEKDDLTQKDLKDEKLEKTGKVIRISKLPYFKNLLKRAVEEANKADIPEPYLVLPKEWEK
jgi:hypothetical protein